MLENIREEIKAKIGFRITVYRQLGMQPLLFSHNLKIAVGDFFFIRATPWCGAKDLVWN